MTTSSVAGFTIGAGATALVQSSSAITALAVTLVDAGAITFRGSLGILLGANVGTTVTAWLVSLKLTGIGPAFIVLGTVVSIVPFRVKVFGQALFYFGLIFFSLELVSGSLPCSAISRCSWPGSPAPITRSSARCSA
ncbi:MAG: Na/Pi symporter [Kofleriaceae bacterium]|nr:Na/Pi symporter [Kofleriaceae bacterium]